jgi:hypothetical protein
MEYNAIEQLHYYIFHIIICNYILPNISLLDYILLENRILFCSPVYT